MPSEMPYPCLAILGVVLLALTRFRPYGSFFCNKGARFPLQIK
jgi:hypothetical protein